MAQRYYVLWSNQPGRKHQDQMEEIKTCLEGGFTVIIGPIGSLALIEDEHKRKQIKFTPSAILAELETPAPPWLATERTKCVHRLTAGDIPPGMDVDDIKLHCENDPECPKKKGGA